MRSSKHNFKKGDTVIHINGWSGIVEVTTPEEIRVCINHRPGKCFWYAYYKFQANNDYEIF